MRKRMGTKKKRMVLFDWFFIVLCLARGSSRQVQTTQGFSAYHFLFQALTLVGRVYCPGDNVHACSRHFTRDLKGVQSFYEDGHCWCLPLFWKAAAPRPDPSHCFIIFCKCGHLNMWERFGRHTAAYSLFIIHMISSVVRSHQPPFTGLNWGGGSKHHYSNPHDLQVCALNFANGKDVGQKLGMSFCCNNWCQFMSKKVVSKKEYHPYLGKGSNLTSIFFSKDGLKPPTSCVL